MPSIQGPFGFPAEEFLADVPPNYPRERLILSVLLGITFVFFAILPVLLSQPAVPVPPSKGAENEASAVPTTNAATAKSSNRSKKRSKQSNPQPQQAQSQTQPDNEVVVEVNAAANALSVVGALFVMTALLVLKSPHNYYTTNAVFQAPLLTRDECDTILQFAEEAAFSNYQNAKSIEAMYALMDEQPNATVQQLLMEPYGWNKLRHQEYPTTDLNLVTDPFTKEHRQWIQEKLDSRLAPLLQRIWGIPPNAIRANDMFVVRYDADKQTHLVNHTDDASISINILLDDGFEGGGTRFWNKITGKPFAHVQPTQVGQVLMHGALMNHEGVHVTKGRRTILVAFLEVDRTDPFQKPPTMTGLSWYASWGSLDWLETKMKQGYYAAHHRLEQHEEDWKNNIYIRSFMATATVYLSKFSDTWFEPKVHNMVDDANRDQFLQALEDAYQRGQRPSGGSASWFAGQQITIDITGKIIEIWSTRENNVHRFNEL